MPCGFDPGIFIAALRAVNRPLRVEPPSPVILGALPASGFRSRFVSGRCATADLVLLTVFVRTITFDRGAAAHCWIKHQLVAR
jgi:hypothetical protein